MDLVNQKTRSRIMAAVGRKNTAPELRLRSALHRLGLRFRLNVKNLPGSPDIVLPKYKTVVFVHGCFWHRHGCSKTTTPKTRQEFWNAKFEANRARDERKEAQLRELGWRVITVWECEVLNTERLIATVEYITGILRLETAE
ncbi:MAG: DNA mismatch endonuclease Vsr [Bradyrhizobiaceae bacterium]|nr:DNA mismatch endonuclease Vsr [Bradyrhizobiaceae bacterium]